MDTVPEHQRVYKTCVYPVACIIVVMYVDNNGVRHNCWELLAEFEADVAKDGRIDLHREGDDDPFIVLTETKFRMTCHHFCQYATSTIRKQERSLRIRKPTLIRC
jgi:hypothetical protein